MGTTAANYPMLVEFEVFESVRFTKTYQVPPRCLYRGLFMHRRLTESFVRKTVNRFTCTGYRRTSFQQAFILRLRLKVETRWGVKSSYQTMSMLITSLPYSTTKHSGSGSSELEKCVGIRLFANNSKGEIVT